MFLRRKNLLYSTEVLFGYISGICSANAGLSMVNISSRYRDGIVELVYEVKPFGFLEV